MKENLMRRVVVPILIAAALVCGGCSQTSNSSGNQTRPHSTAKLKVIEPKPGAVERPGRIEVKLDLIGGRITKVVTTRIKPDVGHIHLRLDGETITLLGSLDQKVSVKKKGPHLLEAEFVAADHGPFDPRILSAVNFTTR
jgi:hypothetical protein